MIAETIFSIPGVGVYIVNAVNNRDYPVVQGGVIILAITFSIIMLACDLLIAAIDPRVKAQITGGKKRGRKMTDTTERKKDENTVKKQNQFLEVMKRLAYNKGAVLGGILFLLVLIVALLAPVLSPFGYAEVNLQERLVSPCAEHLFGTDQMGRDILSRILYGARYSLLIGIGSVLFSAVFGVIIGSISGFYGGWIDNLIMRICDIIQSVPGLILNIALACVLGPGVFNVIFAMGFEGIAGTARLMRSSILNIRKMEYLDAASLTNCSNFRIIVKHILPNTFAPILVQATMEWERGLSWLQA